MYFSYLHVCIGIGIGDVREIVKLCLIIFLFLWEDLVKKSRVPLKILMIKRAYRLQ